MVGHFQQAPRHEREGIFRPCQLVWGSWESRPRVKSCAATRSAAASGKMATGMLFMGIFDSSETILHCEKETIDFGIENRQDHITPGRQPWQQCGKPKRYYSRARNGNFPELARPKTR